MKQYSTSLSGSQTSSNWSSGTFVIVKNTVLVWPSDISNIVLPNNENAFVWLTTVVVAKGRGVLSCPTCKRSWAIPCGGFPDFRINQTGDTGETETPASAVRPGKSEASRRFSAALRYNDTRRTAGQDYSFSPVENHYHWHRGRQVQMKPHWQIKFGSVCFRYFPQREVFNALKLDPWAEKA